MEKAKEWFVGLPPVIALIAVLLLACGNKLVTGKNALAGLADFMEPEKENWTDGIPEAVTAMKVQ